MDNRIRVRRVELKMSQEELAKLTGLCRATILSIEKNRRIPQGDSMIKIAQSLDTQVEKLFFL